MNVRILPNPVSLCVAAFIVANLTSPASRAAEKISSISVTQNEEEIRITTPLLEAAVRKKGYVTGIKGGSFVDKTTGFHDLGYGLDIVDWIMEPGSDEAYRNQLKGDLPYDFNNSYHGKSPKRSIEGPQICTKAKQLFPRVLTGPGFAAIQTDFQYYLAAPGRETGSTWEQTIYIQENTRFFISSDKITAKNSSDAMFLRLDMPGHIKHMKGDNFSEVYLSYFGKIPASEFLTDFAPDEKFLYRRDPKNIPKRFIRAYHTRDPKTGADGPWLAGMTLDPSMVYEAWCHQRGYVCLIQEIGGYPIKAGDSFSAAFIVGFFDSIAEMEKVYDLCAGNNALRADANGWRLTRAGK